MDGVARFSIAAFNGARGQGWWWGFFKGGGSIGLHDARCEMMQDGDLGWISGLLLLFLFLLFLLLLFLWLLCRESGWIGWNWWEKR